MPRPRETTFNPYPGARSAAVAYHALGDPPPCPESWWVGVDWDTFTARASTRADVLRLQRVPRMETFETV